MLMHLVNGHCGSHVPVESLWQAVLGATDQFARGNVLEEQYEHYHRELRHQLREHMMTASERVRYTASAPMAVDGAEQQPEGVSVPGSENGHIQEGAEYRFFLHRHWSLLEAMTHSPYVAAKLSVWNSRGATRLNVSTLRI